MRDHLSINNAITMILAPNLASYSQTKKGRGPIDNAIITHSTIYSLSNFLHRDFYGSETRKIRISNLLHLSLCPGLQFEASHSLMKGRHSLDFLSLPLGERQRRHGFG